MKNLENFPTSNCDFKLGINLEVEVSSIHKSKKTRKLDLWLLHFGKLVYFKRLKKVFSFFSSGTCRVLSVWLDHYPGDFDEPPYYPSLHKIINFVKNDVERQQDKSLCVKTEKLLDKLSVSPFACEGMCICVLSSQVSQIHSLVLGWYEKGTADAMSF